MKKLMSTTWAARAARVCALSLSTVAFVSGCAKLTSSTPSSVSVSGTFAQTSSLPSGLLEGLNFGPVANRNKGLFLQDFSDLSMACLTLSVPPVAYTGDINPTSGAFTIDGLPASTPVRCVIYNSISSSVLATLVYSDASITSMDGSALTVDTVAPSGSSALGTVALNTTVGVATADASKLIQDTAAIGPLDGWDPTGKYVIQPVTFTMPDGYSALCASSSQNCNGPQAGIGLFLKRVAGKVFTPDQTCTAAVASASGHSYFDSNACAGTTGTDAAYAMTVWQGGQNGGGTPSAAEAAFTSCGSKMGISIAEAEAYANVDFSSAAEAGNIVLATQDTSGHALTSGWKDAAATANYPVSNCINLTVTDSNNVSHPAQECFDEVSVPHTYQINFNDGGCVDANNNPVVVTDWMSQIASTMGQCTTTSTTVTLAAVAGHTSAGTLAVTTQACPNLYTATQGATAIPVTCSNTGRAFYEATTGAPNAHTANDPADPVCGQNGCTFPFSWSNANIVAQGGLCNTIVAQGGTQLAEDQCYANYFQQSLRSETSLCLPELRTNWSAATAADFIVDDGPVKSSSQAVLAKAIYLPGNVITMRDTSTNFAGVSIPIGANGGSQWVNCEESQTETITGTKDGDNIQFVYVNESVLTSTDPVCLAADAAGNLGTGKFRTMFTMVPSSN